MNLFLLINLFVLLIVSCSEGYKILAVFNFPIPSLSRLGAGFVRHLLNAGHEVRVHGTYMQLSSQHQLLNQIFLGNICNTISWQ